MTDESVSRETPPVPPEAQGVFGDRLDLAVRFAELLATDGVVRGLIGPREAPRLWERHLLNCAVLEEVIAPGASVCDIGSGAGLPGLVLAIARPDLRLTLVEPLLRRTTFLAEVVEELGLDRVTVERGRAESVAGRDVFDVVTSRAVAALPTLMDWSLPLVAPDGEMIALKGSSAADEAAEAAALVAERGCSPARVVELGVGRVPESTWAIRLAWQDPASVSSARSAATDRPSSRQRSSPGRRSRQSRRRRADGR